MRTRLLTLIALPSLLVGLLGTATGCGPASIEEQCETIAAEQCGACFRCAEGIDEVGGAELCELSAKTTRQACVTLLRNRCEDQASTLEDSSDDLQACVDSFAERTCEPLYAAWAQDGDATTDACAFFL